MLGSDKRRVERDRSNFAQVNILQGALRQRAAVKVKDKSNFMGYSSSFYNFSSGILCQIHPLSIFFGM